MAASIPVMTDDGTNSDSQAVRDSQIASWNTPDSTTASRNASKDGSEAIAPKTITVSPAAGPLTDSGDADTEPTTSPPTIPAINPDISGAPDASAMPRHKGKATSATTTDAATSRPMPGEGLAGSAVTSAPENAVKLQVLRICSTTTQGRLRV